MNTKKKIGYYEIQSIKPVFKDGEPFIEVVMCEPESGCLDVYHSKEIEVDSEGDIHAEFEYLESRTFEGEKIAD